MLRSIIGATILTLLFASLAAYVGRRLADALGYRRRVAAGRALAAIAVVPWLVRFLGAGLPGAREVALFGFAIGLSAALSFGLLAPLDLLIGAVRRIARRVGRSAVGARGDVRASVAPVLASEVGGAVVTSPLAVPSAIAGTDIDETTSHEAADDRSGRRAFVERIAAGAAVTVGSSTAVYGLFRESHDFAIEEVPVVLERLPSQLDGFTIAQLSDIHVGAFVREGELRRGLELVARMRPDLVVLTGDLVDHDPDVADILARFTRRLADLDVRHGVVAISGNHDYYAGVDRVLDAVRRSGARVLRNQGELIGEGRAAFSLLGIEDVWGTNHRAGDLEETLRHAAPDTARVLLCHNPELFPESAEHVDLQLSGHTHGGQIVPIVNPTEWVLRHGYVRGLYRRGASQIYVNRGFGTVGPPARIGAPPEVTKIVLSSRA